MIEGVVVNMGGKDWTIPALSFKQVRTLLPKINTLSTASTSGAIAPEQMGDIAEIIHAAVSRNYPEVTLDEIEDMLDLRNTSGVLLAVMGQSGMEPAQAGEAQAGSR